MSEDEQMQLAQHEREQQLLHLAEKQEEAEQYYAKQTEAYIAELKLETERLRRADSHSNSATIAELAYRDKRIDKLEVELAAYTTAEINDPTTWPTIERQRARIKGLEARLNYESLLTEDERTTRLQLKEENERLRDEVIFLNKQQQLDNEDAERYRWGLEHPSLMANYFIKWKTKHDHYNHRNPGVHPSDAIDAAMEGK